MAKTALRLSLVIPVYNEQHHIKACLEAIKNQTVAPFEVIVVDNNCTDETIAIASNYDFVRVVTEPHQGRGWARSTGFNSAQGELIGRIDADTRLASGWIEHVLTMFETHHVDAITGLAYTALFPRIRAIKSTLWSRVYYYFVHASFRTTTLWGANMVLRRSAWEVVANQVCLDDKIVHEDQDVSIELAAKGYVLQQDNDLLMTTGGQTYNYLPKLVHYYKLERSTRAYHMQKGTLLSPQIKKLSKIASLPGLLLATIAGLYMGIVSILWYPIDRVMIAAGRQKTWLD